MLKTSTDQVRHALNGATMGTRWSALFYTDSAFDPAPVQAALQKAVDRVDVQMSTWNPDSVLMQLNRAPLGAWVEVPDDLVKVLTLALHVGEASGGAFDIGMGDAVRAWGFGPQQADVDHIRSAMAVSRRPAYSLLALEGRQVRKLDEITIDLNGIAKGYGVDRLAETLQEAGIKAALVGIDGEMRAWGCRPDGEVWTIAVEAPDPDLRAPHSMLCLHDAAVATSGDYRHWVNVNGRRLAHTMDPRRGAPLVASPASVTVVASTCAEADAWATALMVMGLEAGKTFAARKGLSALFLTRDDAGGVMGTGCGRVFDGSSAV